MAIRPDDPTCADIRKDEACGNIECHETFAGQPNVQQLIEEFFGGNGSERLLEFSDLVYKAELCGELLRNGAETVCVHENTDGKCCDTHESRTGCNDPDKCPSRNYGLDIVAVMRAALHASQMAYVPIQGMARPTKTDPNWNIPDGSTLVWSSSAVPDNPNCDPCYPDVTGAFVVTTP